jgi:hypothetical protein
MADDLRATRQECVTLTIPYLGAARSDGWSHLVTGDELWFFVTSAIRRMWSLASDDVAKTSRTVIAT